MFDSLLPLFFLTFFCLYFFLQHKIDFSTPTIHGNFFLKRFPSCLSLIVDTDKTDLALWINENSVRMAVLPVDNRIEPDLQCKNKTDKTVFLFMSTGFHCAKIAFM